MEFIPFLYCNTKLGPPKGQEVNVLTIDVFRGMEYATACVKFNEEELAEIQKTGVVWVSLMQPPPPKNMNWPPIRVEAFIPVHKPTQCLIFGELMKTKLHLIQYMDLNLYVLEVNDNESEFTWDLMAKAGTDADGKAIDIWNLRYKVPGDSHYQGEDYLFGEELQVLGRLKDIPALQPLQYIFPMLKDEHLCLVHKPEEPKATIFGLNGKRLN